MSTRHQVVLGFFGLAAILVVVVAVSRWEVIAREYHLAGLRKDASLLDSMLLAGGPREDAARKFILEPRGRAALFRLYLDEFGRNELQGSMVNPAYLRGLKDGKVIGGYFCLWKGGYAFQSFGEGARGFSLATRPKNQLRRNLVVGLLSACQGEVLRLEEYAHLEFLIQPVEEGEVKQPPWTGKLGARLRHLNIRRGTTHVCFFRVLKESS